MRKSPTTAESVVRLLNSLGQLIEMVDQLTEVGTVAIGLVDVINDLVDRECGTAEGLDA